MLRICISAKLLAEANRFTSQEPTRYCLSGARIEPSKSGGVLVVATDGICMGVFHDPEGAITEPAIIRNAADMDFQAMTPTLAPTDLLAIDLRRALFRHAVPFTEAQWRARWRKAVGVHRACVRRGATARRDWPLADWIVVAVHSLRRAHTASIGRTKGSAP